MELSERTKRNISELLGIPYEQLLEMDDEEIRNIAKRSDSKKITWPKHAKVDGLPIQTMAEVDKGLDKIIKKKDDDWER